MSLPEPLPLLEIAESLRVAFHGDREGIAELTLGQRNTWGWVNTGADDDSAILDQRLEIPMSSQIVDLAAAFAVLMARHEILRTRFVSIDASDGLPRQHIASTGELLIDMYTISTPLPDVGPAADEAESAIAAMLIGDLRMKGINLATELPLRVAVATADGIPRVAVLITSHVTLDLGSLMMVAHQFSALVAESVAGKALEVRAPEHQPQDQAAIEQSPAGQRRAAASTRYWQSRLRDAPQALFPVPRPNGDDVVGSGSLHLRSPAAGLALSSIATRTRTASPTVLMAAMCAILSLRANTRRCTITVMSGNRYWPRLRNYIGALAQDSLVAFEIDGQTFDDVVRRAGAASLVANMHSQHDPASLWQMRDELDHAQGTRFTRDVSYNNVSSYFDNADRIDSAAESGSLDPARLSELLTLSTLTWEERETLPEVMVFYAVAFEPELSAVIYTNTSYLPRSELELIFGGIEKLLVATAFDEVPLDQLGDITGIEPVKRGPDWAWIEPNWIELSAVRALLVDALGVPDVHIAVHKVDDKLILVAHIPATATIATPQAAHIACMKRLATRYTAIAPGYYVLCDGVPANIDDETAWQELPVIAEGSGR